MKKILETSRLILREFMPEDAKEFYELNADYEVIRYTGNEPFESEAVAREFLENYDHYKIFGYGRWPVILKETGEWLGWCGLKFDEEFQATDVGYRFHKRNWGKGYATESAAACLDYGFKELNLERIIGCAMKANPASIRIFEKIGMRFVRDRFFDGIPGVEYEKLKVEM